MAQGATGPPRDTTDEFTLSTHELLCALWHPQLTRTEE